MVNQMDDKKIFMLSSVHFWQDTRIFFKEAKSLAGHDFLVDFFAIGQNESYESNSEKNLNIHILPKNNSKFRVKKWHFLYKEALRSDAKYYHFHDPELLLVARKIKKKKPNVVIVYDMHENFPKQLRTKEWIPRMIRKPFAFIIKNCEKKLLNSCDQIIFAETSYKQDYEDVNIPKIDILNYPLYVEERSVEKEHRKFTLIYVGDITEDRNIFGMIEIANLLKYKFRCVFCLKLIGTIDAKLKVRVEQLIDRYQLNDVVEWYGRIPYDELWTYYFEADIGLCLLHPIPNYEHSMATKLFEYMAAKLPIVASNFLEWQGLIQETKSGITVDPFDYPVVADQIFELLNNPDTLKKYGESGRRAFEKKFSWSTEEKKLVSMYTKRME